jgi:hypothetical protein
MQHEATEYGRLMGLAMVDHAFGKEADSNAALARMIREQADGNAFGIAEVYAYRDQPDEAMLWLERALAQRDAFLVYIKAELSQTKLAADPRFKAFLRKLNLPE